MGRFHRHDDGTVHAHEHDGSLHEHGDHSRYQTGAQRIDVLEAIFAENDVLVHANRAAFGRNGVRALNLMSSPVSEKTTILQVTLEGQLALVDVTGEQRKALRPDPLGESVDIELLLRWRCRLPSARRTAPAAACSHGPRDVGPQSSTRAPGQCRRRETAVRWRDAAVRPARRAARVPFRIRPGVLFGHGPNRRTPVGFWRDDEN